DVGILAEPLGHFNSDVLNDLASSRAIIELPPDQPEGPGPFFPRHTVNERMDSTILGEPEWWNPFRIPPDGTKPCHGTLADDPWPANQRGGRFGSWRCCPSTYRTIQPTKKSGKKYGAAQRFGAAKSLDCALDHN